MDVSLERKELFTADGFDLASDARKSYYRELVSFAREELLTIPEGYLQHLKALFFEGAISIDPWVAFRGRAPLLICLSSPSVDRRFVIETFASYEAHCAYYDVEMYEMHIFGRANFQWPLIIERFESVVEYLADDGLKFNSSDESGLRSQYLSLYFRVFYLYKKGGDVRVGFAQNIIEYVEGIFEDIQALEASADTLRAFPKAFSPIFSGEIINPEIAYADPILLAFIQRFFAKHLPPTLQALVEGVYAQLEHPVKLVGGRVEY
ncbi:MAG: hypothetical protein ACRCTL_08645 [Pseudomonas sp.]